MIKFSSDYLVDSQTAWERHLDTLLSSANSLPLTKDQIGRIQSVVEEIEFNFVTLRSGTHLIEQIIEELR